MWFFLIIFYSNISKGLRIKSCLASLAYLVGTLYYIWMWSEFEPRSSYLTTKVKFQITKPLEKKKNPTLPKCGRLNIFLTYLNFPLTNWQKFFFTSPLIFSLWVTILFFVILLLSHMLFSLYLFFTSHLFFLYFWYLERSYWIMRFF
jgi:hypothetical protein